MKQLLWALRRLRLRMPPLPLPQAARVAVYSRFTRGTSSPPQRLVRRSDDWRDATFGVLANIGNQPHLMTDEGGSAQGVGVIFYPTEESESTRHVTSVLQPDGDPILTDVGANFAVYAGAWTVPMRWLNRYGPGYLRIAPISPASVTSLIFSASDKWREVTVSLGSVAFSAADVDASRTLAVATGVMPAFLLPPFTELWGTDGSGVLAMAVTLPWFVSEEGEPRLQVFPALTATRVQVLARAGYWREVLLRASAAATIGFDAGSAGTDTFAVPTSWVMRFRLPPETALWAASSASAQLEIMSCKSPRMRS